MSVSVRVPATSANLGPGFDTLGIALELFDEVSAEAELGDGPLGNVHIEVRGVGEHAVPRDVNHLVAQAMVECFHELGVKPTALQLQCHNQIPHGRGLGSSAAAIVAGVLLARALAGERVANRMSDEDVLALATRLEGHPDNVAPCLLGGLTISWMDAAGTARAVRREVDSRIQPIILQSEEAVSTELARGLLPRQVPHADAAHNAARSALLVEALTHSPEFLLEATDDRLHQKYRAQAMLGTMSLIEVLRANGHAAVISGAGPAVLVLSSADADLGPLPPGWQARVLDVCASGSVVSATSGV